MSVIIGGTVGAVVGMGAVTAVAGAGASMYGANKNAKAINNANKTNQQIAADTNAANYQLWQESRGIKSDGSVTNAKLPQWMTVRVNGAPTIKRTLVKRGQSVPQESRLTPYSTVSASPYLSSKVTDAETKAAEAAAAAIAAAEKKKKGSSASLPKPESFYKTTAKSMVRV